MGLLSRLPPNPRHARGLVRRGSPLFFLLFSSFLMGGCARYELSSANAVGGRVDLSKDGLAGPRIVRLDGEWEFYPGILAKPGELEGFRGRGEKAFMTMPGIWGSSFGFSGPSSNAVGTATLRLTVTLPPDYRRWVMRIPNANSAAAVYVDGRLLAEIGRVSEDARAYVPSNGVAYPAFTAGGETVIVMQVANYSTPYIGTWDAPTLGPATVILERNRSDTVITALVAGALIIMGLYHLGLFLLRRKDQAPLWFGIICLFMSARTMMMGERLMLSLFSQSVAGWEWAFKVEHLSAHLVLPLFALFFRCLFPRSMGRLPLRILLAGGALWAIMVLFLPSMIYQRFLHWYEIFLFVGGVYGIGVIAVAVARREAGARIVLAGLTVLMVTVVNDVFFSMGLLANTVYLSSYGVFLYIFAQSFQLSVNFAKAFRDIEVLSANLGERNRELEALHIIDRAIVSSEDLGTILSVIIEQAVEHLRVDAADILLLDGDSGTLSLGARVGFRTDALVHTRLRAGEGYAGQALLRDDAIYVSGLDKNADGFARSPAFSAEDFLFYAGRRLTVNGRTVGVIELYQREAFEITPGWDLFFRSLAGQAAVALDNSELLNGLRKANAELEKAYEGTIESWAEALELRDQETEGHSRRVTEATLLLAREFGIDGRALDCVRYGSLLHDIGKMGIPDNVLLKPGPLTHEEFTLMKKHPDIARNLLSRLKFLEDALDIPYCHHEKWDGTGYPQGLAGKAIPLSARLFAVVDVWDALRSDRPYRAAWSEERVLEHLLSLSGTHFDPEAVERFVAIRRSAPLTANPDAIYG